MTQVNFVPSFHKKSSISNISSFNCWISEMMGRNTLTIFRFNNSNNTCIALLCYATLNYINVTFC